MTGIVIAHGGVKDSVERCMNNWKEAFEQVILIAPYDDPLPGQAMHIGQSCRNGIGAIERMLVACILASRFKVAAVMEYDTLIFETIPDFHVSPDALLCGQVFVSDEDKFQAKHYPHSPWIARGDAWWKILNAGAGHEEGNPDRWLALACQNAGVPMFTLTGSFSCDREWTPEVIAEAVQARKKGAISVHGFKTKEAFHTLTA